MHEVQGFASVTHQYRFNMQARKTANYIQQTTQCKF